MDLHKGVEYQKSFHLCRKSEVPNDELQTACFYDYYKAASFL